MSRLLIVVLSVGAIFCAVPQVVAQQTRTLRVNVRVVDADLNVKPVPKHVLIVRPVDGAGESRRLAAGFDGVLEVTVSAGEYIVESDKPLEFQGKSYRWTQTVTVAGSDVVLDLSNDNAVVAISESTPPRGPASDLPSLFREWQDSVVTVWSATGHGSGFLIDGNGLIATNEHVIGTSEYVAVQVGPTLKVPARVVVANVDKDVAILAVNPKVFEQVRPVRLGFAKDGKSPAVEGQQVFTIGSPLNQRKVMTSGIVSRIEQRAIISDVNINHGNSGGPLFTTDGLVIGITTFGDFTAAGGPGISGIVRIDEAADEIARAKISIEGKEPPAATQLPVEPLQGFPVNALRATVESREVKLKDYQLGASEFDLTFVTPTLLYGIQYQLERENLKERAKRNSKAGAVRDSIKPFADFKNWAEYVGEYRPVLMIRATPKLIEGFWSAFGRGLAASQGYYAGPANMRFKADFYRMQVFCGASEVTPIHPSKIEHRLAVDNSAVRVNDATYEGLYTFAPDAIGPHCGTVRLVLFTEKEPEKGRSVELSSKSLDWLWRDFAPYRAVAAQ